jgi:hypothetical protein
MADGSEVMAPIFLGTVRFPELDEDVAEMVGVTVSVLGDQALIGQSVLRRFTLQSASRQTLLVNSKTCGEAGLQATFESQRDRVHVSGDTHAHGAGD